jgi:hypothetical protein
MFLAARFAACSRTGPPVQAVAMLHLSAAAAALAPSANASAAAIAPPDSDPRFMTPSGLFVCFVTVARFVVVRTPAADWC